MVLDHDAATREVEFNDRFLAFATYWGFRPRACAPYRAAQLTVGKLQLAGRSPGHSLVTLRGKGGKTRLCPLLQDSARALANLAEGRASGEAVFPNRLGRPITDHPFRHSPGGRALRGESR